jgi:hypothetical protein
MKDCTTLALIGDGCGVCLTDTSAYEAHWDGRFESDTRFPCLEIWDEV